jgi:hypothetical protein
LNGYLLQLEKILFRSSRGSDLPVVPSSLYRHFFGLWFSGGVWPAAEDYPWKVAEHDASPQLLSEIENDTVPLDPVCVVQQIERWSAWLSLQACETKVSRPRYNRIGEVLALKSQGLSAKSIALELGVSHQTVRAALMRHRQRVDATAEPADNATSGSLLFQHVWISQSRVTLVYCCAVIRTGSSITFWTLPASGRTCLWYFLATWSQARR